LASNFDLGPNPAASHPKFKLGSKSPAKPLDAAFPALQKIKIGSKASPIVIGLLANNPKH
jgi:hypothetical protein